MNRKKIVDTVLQQCLLHYNVRAQDLKSNKPEAVRCRTAISYILYLENFTERDIGNVLGYHASTISGLVSKAMRDIESYEEIKEIVMGYKALSTIKIRLKSLKSNMQRLGLNQYDIEQIFEQTLSTP